MENGRSWLRRRAERLARREYALSTLLGFVTITALLPFLLLGAYALSRYAAISRAEELAHVAIHSQILAQTVDRELWGHIDAAQIPAGSRFLQQGNIRAFDDLVRDVAVNARGDYVLVDRTGREIVDTRVPPGAELPKAANPEEVEFVFDFQRRHVGNLAMDSVRQELLFAVHIPVFVDGGVGYVLSYIPRRGVIPDVLRQDYPARGWQAAVVDGFGRIIAESSGHAESFGKPFPKQILDRVLGRRGLIQISDGGTDLVFAHHASDLSDWQVLVWVPMAQLQAPSNTFIRFGVAVAVVTLLVSLGAAVLAGRAIERPTRRLLKAVRSMGDGKPVRYKPSIMREANVVGQALEEASRNIRFVMLELSHRSKNLLAVIQAMARQTGRTAGNVKEFETRMIDRIISLSRSHDLLVERSWQGIPVADLVAAQLAPFIDWPEARVSASGPPMRLTPEAAQHIGMALQELATNASKHGALSVPSGRVAIAWGRSAGTAGGEPRFSMSWEESKGPIVLPPARRGFGSTIIEQVVATTLNGTARLDWNESGVVWRLDVPAKAVEVDSGDAHPSAGGLGAGSEQKSEIRSAPDKAGARKTA